MSEPTSLPWTARGQHVYDSTEHEVKVAYCGTVAGAGRCKDGEFRSFGVTEKEAKAHAAYIAKACNAFPDLVKALEKIGETRWKDDLDSLDDIIKIATDALAAVKGAPDHG